MGPFKKLLLVLSVMVYSNVINSQVSEQKPKTCDSRCVSFEDHFRFLPLFKTIQDYVSFLKNLNLLSAAEHSELVAEFKKLNILDTKINEWPILNGKSIILNEAKLIKFSDTDFLSSTGNRIRVDHKKSFVENFLVFNRALTFSEKASIFNLLVFDSAWAVSPQQQLTTSLISIATVAASLKSIPEVVGTCVPGAAITAAGKAAQIIKSAILFFRPAKFESKVECNQGRYMFKQPKQVHFDSDAEFEKHYEWITKYDKDAVSKIYGYCYALVNAGDKNAADALAPYNCSNADCIREIAKTEVSQILNLSPSETPECNPNTALRVQNFKRKKAEADEANLLNAISSAQAVVGDNNTSPVTGAEARGLTGR